MTDQNKTKEAKKAQAVKGKIWEAYYSHFSLSADQIREGCEPRLFDSGKKCKNSIVLVHGLTDSLYFMQAIGHYFHEKMGFNVFLPLLQEHDVRSPLPCRSQAGARARRVRQDARRQPQGL